MPSIKVTSGIEAKIKSEGLPSSYKAFRAAHLISFHYLLERVVCCARLNHIIPENDFLRSRPRDT